MRKSNWEERLADYLAGAAEKPHEYGVNDCMLFVAGAVKATTGKDPGRGHRRKYDTAKGAVRYLKRLGFDSPEAMLDSLFEEKPVAFAQRGDIVLSDDEPGICIGGEALFVGIEVDEDGTERRAGLIRRPRAEWDKAWAVG
jgi:hypothetical protein